MENNNNNNNQSKVYAAVGVLATELRANVNISPGEIILTEPAFAFASETDDDDDDDALPSIVQVAMNALIKSEKDDDNDSTKSCNRKWSDLMSEIDTDDVQKKTLFAWGANQIMSLRHDEKEAMEAIQRVSLNAFTVKRQTDASTINVDEIADDTDLINAVMTIGNESTSIGNGVYLLASAANHSCVPNAYVTFDDDRTITFRAISPIQAHITPITISYGPIAGVDGDFRQRRSDINALGTHDFVCQCAACISEETTSSSSSSTNDEIEATAFIETYITSGNLTAEEALLQSKLGAPDSIVQSKEFGKAMSDTSIQTISYDVNVALGFQKLALKSLELRCNGDDVLAVAYELIKLSLLRLFCEEQNVNDIGRARGILVRYFGEDYPYKELLDALVSAGTA